MNILIVAILEFVRRLSELLSSLHFERIPGTLYIHRPAPSELIRSDDSNHWKLFWDSQKCLWLNDVWGWEKKSCSQIHSIRSLNIWVVQLNKTPLVPEFWNLWHRVGKFLNIQNSLCALALWIMVLRQWSCFWIGHLFRLQIWSVFWGIL